MTIDPAPLTQNPFAVITIIAAPAILTNAASILTLSTSTRLMRCLDRINHITERLDRGHLSPEMKATYLKHIDLSHRQSEQFLNALRASYATLACFAIASLGALIGAATTTLFDEPVIETIGILSIFVGGLGVIGLLLASVNLIKASRITMVIMSADMEHVRKHHSLTP
jgi:hypothetical protein